MKPRMLILPLLAIVLTLALIGDAHADISNAAVLYLRIAPGARAAGMGEAFVAIADDATATHWNPAGLGAYPLASSWIERKVPAEFRPLESMAAIKSGGAGDYTAYELWAITGKGLARFDNKDWFTGEVFNTRTDQTVPSIVASYFNITDEERLAEIVEKVAIANNRFSYEYLENLHASVAEHIPDDYTARQTTMNMLDSLLVSFTQCRIDWNRLGDVEDYLREGLKDSVLTEVEIDRISIAVEKSRTRFIPEELIVPYNVNLPGTPSSIASTGEYVLVGTDRGLVTYNGKRWQTLTVASGLPSDTITCLASDGSQIYIGTAQGLARFDDYRLAPIMGKDEIPVGSISAVGARTTSDIWMAVDKELYHWDGYHWANSIKYTVALDDTPEKIAEKFGLFGSTVEKQKFLDKYFEINAETGGRGVEAVAGEPESNIKVQADLPEDIMAALRPEADSTTTDSTVADSLTAAADTTASEPEVATVEETDSVEPIAPDASLEAGKVVRAPFVGELKGEATSIYVGPDNRVWIGTEYGVYYFNGKGWELPGYRTYRIKDGDTFEALVAAKRHDKEGDAEVYAAQLTDINDFDEAPLEVGQRVKIYRNPAATRVNKITRSGERLFFATDVGMIQYDGYYWSRSGVSDLDHSTAVDARAFDNELWLASDEKIVVKANALKQLTLMHVKWLPELTDDVYYEFVSFVAGSEEWGTFGGNVTFISYGSFLRTGEQGDTLGTFDSFDIAFTGSYGTALSPKLKVGISAKLLYSKLSDLGTGLEKGKGTSTGFAVDFGMLYLMSPRLTWGLALTNLGPKMAYIDASQADDLPRNLALGFAYKLLQTDYYHLLVTSEVNKILVGLDDGLGEELKQLVVNSGAEFLYANIIALRAGYIYDDEGDVKTATLGVGLALFNAFKFDFSYIPSNSTESLRNTLRISVTVIP